MRAFTTRMLPAEPDVRAPDGSEVRRLLALERGSMAHFRLGAGEVARAVRHRTVEEIWFVVFGAGQIWRLQDGRAEIVELTPDQCVSIPVGAAFQFRASPTEALGIVGVTMPPWPGEDEALPADGPWTPTV